MSDILANKTCTETAKSEIIQLSLD